MAKSATVVKPPATTIPQAQTAARGGSRRWILIGSAAAVLVVGAAAAIPWLTAPPPSALERERPSIEAAMERYRLAYRNRSLEGVAEAFPALPRDARQAMQKTFTNCLVYEVTFAGMKVDLSPTDETLAQAALTSTHTCTPQSGGRDTTTTQRETFALRKTGDSWLIDSVTRAPAASPNRAQ